MIYIHYCESCETIHMLNGHKIACPICNSSLYELKISFKEYIELLPDERSKLQSNLCNPDYLRKKKKHYRFAKHTERYKKRNIGL